MIDILFLNLLQCSLFDTPIDESLIKDMDKAKWNELFSIATKQRVNAICLQGINKIVSGKYDFETIGLFKINLMKEIGHMLYADKQYQRHIDIIQKLAYFFISHKVPMVLLKGYGLSKEYPIPQKRLVGDIDIYHCGKGVFADELIRSKGIYVKQNEEKHSIYKINEVIVENHASIINNIEHKSLNEVEGFLEKELLLHSIKDNITECLLPSTMFNVVFLPLHFAGHFVYGGANLRQIVDYALVVKNANLNSDTNQIDWERVKALAIEGGYFKFLCCLNGICMDHIGIPSDCFPDWPRYKDIEERMLAEILNPKSVNVNSLPSKIKRYFKNRWKYQLVYSKENHLMGFLLRIRSWVNWKWGNKSVWNRK